MTLEANNPLIEDDDLSTTAPNPRSSAWKMPEPVFRKTSGRLPQGFEKEFEKAKAERAVSEPDTATQAITEMPDTSPSMTPPESKSSTLKLVLVLLGLAAMIAFIAAFLTLVYFFLLR